LVSNDYLTERAKVCRRRGDLAAALADYGRAITHTAVQVVTQKLNFSFFPINTRLRQVLSKLMTTRSPRSLAELSKPMWPER
jgi:hypothetical protein